MGKLRGFLEIERHRAVDASRRRAPARLARVRAAARRTTSCASRRARCMDCGIPFCHDGCPLGNLIPDWNDHVYARALATRRARAARDQQLPRDHRARLPGAVRSVVRAQHRAAAGHDQERSRSSIIDRAFERRAALAPVPAPVQTGKRVAVVGSGPGGPRGGAAAGARGPRRHRVRARRSHRRPACATASPTSRWRRTSRSAHRADAGRGRRLPHRRRRAASTSPATSCAPSYDAVVLCRRRDEAARSAGARARARAACTSRWIF